MLADAGHRGDHPGQSGACCDAAVGIDAVRKVSRCLEFTFVAADPVRTDRIEPVAVECCALDIRLLISFRRLQLYPIADDNLGLGRIPLIEREEPRPPLLIADQQATAVPSASG